MPDRSLAVELRHSVSLLRTEWWLFAGGFAGYFLYGVWVVATGRAVQSVAPEFGARTITTVGATPISGLVAFAAVAWLLAPAAAAAWFLHRRLSNTYGNLATQYRLDHPGVLPAPAGVAMVLAAAAAVAVGPRPAVLAVMAVASALLFVRTVAFGRRVYSFSPRPLFPAMTAGSGAALAAAWLVGAPGLPGQAGTQVATAGVPVVVETGLTAVGLAPATALGVLVAVPAVLSGGYLAVQTLVAGRVRSKAPLANPRKRAEQRYPIMPPVGDSSRPGSPTDNGSAADVSSSTPESTESSADPDQSSSDDRSDTRVFTADDPIPEADDAMATVNGDGDRSTDDGWIDDTAIYSPEGADGAQDECGSCGEPIPEESVTFCPDCGSHL